MTDAGGFNRVETLRNGLAVTLRALCPDDRERIVAALSAPSAGCRRA